MKKIYKYLAILPVAISLLGYGGFPARATEVNEEKTIEITKSYTSYDPDENIGAIFEEFVEQGGITYEFSHFDTKIIRSEPEEEEQLVSIETKPVYEKVLLENSNPDPTIIQDGVTYYLVGSEAVSSVVESRTEYGKTTLHYTDLEYIDELPTDGELTITDSLTGKQYKRSLPRSGYKITAEHWKDDFSFPIKIYSVDADYYTLGGLVIPRGEDLTQYGHEFLSYLGLSEEYYRVNSITLHGDPFEQDGEWVQNGTAYGSRRTVDVAATFEGSITLPEETAWHYQCVYSNLDSDKEIKTIYEMQATATYKQTVEPEEPNYSLWEQLIKWIQDHPVISIVIGLAIISVTIAAILAFLAKKRKKREEEDE